MKKYDKSNPVIRLTNIYTRQSDIDILGKDKAVKIAKRGAKNELAAKIERKQGKVKRKP